MAMPPMLRWALARVPLRKAEKERLEREEFEAKGFVSNLERLLLAVDESPNGKFASRLAGLLAGSRGIPITVVPLSRDDGRNDQQKQRAPDASDLPESAVKMAAEGSGRTGTDAAAAVDVTIRKVEAPSVEAIAEEAKKGYDLLLVGIERTRAKSGFHAEAARIASAFEGPLALVAGSNAHLQEPERSSLHILVPVNGTDVSRRAAEVAIAIAGACACPLAALYVSNPGARAARKRRTFRARRHEEAIVKDIVDLAGRYDVSIKTAVRADVAPDQAIVTESRKAGSNVIIMGVGRRPGDKLFFGDTAGAVFEHAPISIVFVAS